MTVYFDIVVRTLLVLFLLLVVTRILGRRTLSELTFYDFVLSLILGQVGGAIITDKAFGIENGTVALVICTLWILAINMLTLKSIPARKLIEAEPLLVISRGKILENNLKKRYYNVNDLLEMLREQGTFDPYEVEAALIEADGQLSVLKKPEYASPVRKDLNLQPQKMPAGTLAGREVIIDGKIIDRGLLESGLTREELKAKLLSMGILNTDDVILAMITPEGELYVDKRAK